MKCWDGIERFCPACNTRYGDVPRACGICGVDFRERPPLTKDEVAKRALSRLRGPTVGPDGRIVGGTYHGMTPAEVLADRDAYNRARGGAEKQTFGE